MVLDNANDIEVFHPKQSHSQDSKSEHSLSVSSPLAAYLPQSYNGSILITSRSKNAAARLTGSYKISKKFRQRIKAKPYSFSGISSRTRQMKTAQQICFVPLITYLLQLL